MNNSINIHGIGKSRENMRIYLCILANQDVKKIVKIVKKYD